MEFQTIIDKIDNGAYDKIKYPKLYKETYIFDEDKSVKWNRKEVENQNAKLIQEFNNSKIKQENFQEDVIEYILSNYEINNNRNIANIVFRMIYEYDHLNGYKEVLKLYEGNYVFDEDKSVKWNKKEVKKQNAKLLQIFNNCSKMKQPNFKENTIEYILNNYEIDNKRDIANMLFHMVYKSSYSNGYRKILQEIAILALMNCK